MLAVGNEDVFCTLWKELKKDLPFFGVYGFVVGLLVVAPFLLKVVAATNIAHLPRRSSYH